METICSKTKEQVDLLVYNAVIYTVNEQYTKAEAFAVKKGRFVAVGSTEYICDNYTSEQELDWKGKWVYPGFHDAHCHLILKGIDNSYAKLDDAKNFNEILDRVNRHKNKHHLEYEWVVGVGWDQHKWDKSIEPTNKELNRQHPDVPIVLRRTDCHAVIANEKAIERLIELKGESAINQKEANFETGVFVENTANLFMTTIIEQISDKKKRKLILQAAEECYQNGLTSITDAGIPAGLPLSYIKMIDDLQKSGDLKLRVNALIDPKENIEIYKETNLTTDRLTVRCIKLIMDGALGSNGAFMLAPFENEPYKTGICNYPNEEIKVFLDFCQRAYDAGLQVATHCIGDRANQEVLKLYEQVFKKNNVKGVNDLRWRIEHAQIIDKGDFEKFRKNSVVPSVQPTHATSDTFVKNAEEKSMAENKLGKERLHRAYAYKNLKEQLGWLPFGTDFPVEEINPIHTFFAAIFRKKLIRTKDGFKIAEGDAFQIDDAVSREDALSAMTIWAAKASFDEGKKGSIDCGKWADFVVLDRDIINEEVKEQDIPNTKVLCTYIAGEEVYNHENNN